MKCSNVCELTETESDEYQHFSGGIGIGYDASDDSIESVFIDSHQQSSKENTTGIGYDARDDSVESVL